MSPVTQFCSECKSFRNDIVRTEEGTGRTFCVDCVARMPLPPEVRATQFLLATIPFKPGDRVECRTGNLLYDGIGTVQRISMNLLDGGTPACPTFLVKIEEKAYPEAPDEEWFTEICLKRVEAA